MKKLNLTIKSLACASMLLSAGLFSCNNSKTEITKGETYYLDCIDDSNPFEEHDTLKVIVLDIKDGYVKYGYKGSTDGLSCAIDKFERMYKPCR